PVRAQQLELVARDRVVLEDLLDDVGDRQLLEDPAVRGARQQPQPGLELHLVHAVLALEAALREARHVAAEITRRVVAQRDRQRRGLAQQVRGLDVLAFAQQRQRGVSRVAQTLPRYTAVH